MNINPLSAGINGASSSLQKTAARIQNTIAAIVSGNKLKASQDVASLAIAAQLQSQVSGLRQTAGNISQALSLTQVASDAVDQQLAITDRLQQIATQANSPVVSEEARKSLNNEFKALSEELDRISDQTSFNNKKLLDGTFSLTTKQALGDNDADSVEGDALAVDDLSASSLFEGETPDVLTQANAQAALASVAQARETLMSTRAEIGSFGQSLDFAGASIESALFNQEAARSTLADTDFAEASTELALLNLQRNAGLALQAQTKKLPPNLLDLINNT